MLAIMILMVGCSAQVESTTDPVIEEQIPVTKSEVLRWGIDDQIVSLDPAINTQIAGEQIINNIFEGLMRLEGNELKPAAAKGYSVSNDQKTYTFDIRDNKWSDGMAVTAHDFEYAWNRLKEEPTKSWFLYLNNIDDFEAIDDKTFKVTLTKPTDYFLEQMAYVPFFPVRADMDIDSGFFVSNGPFKIADISTENMIMLEKNEYYWQENLVGFENIEIHQIENKIELLKQFESGDIDLIMGVPKGSIEDLQNRNTFYQYPLDSIYYYSINTNREPFNDPLVRQALALAIDRNRIVEALNDGSKASVEMVSEVSLDDDKEVFSEGLDSFLKTTENHTEKAKELLAEAGYPNGEGIMPIEIISNDLGKNILIAQMIEEMWESNLNIDVQIDIVDWADYQERRVRANYDVARGGWTGDYSDPMTYLEMFVTGVPTNYAFWENIEYDQLILEANNSEGEERNDYLENAYGILMEESAYIPIFQYMDQLMVREELVEWNYNDRNLLWLGKAHME
jgi:oligopeptide transport system substrate-binding protein